MLLLIDICIDISMDTALAVANLEEDGVHPGWL